MSDKDTAAILLVDDDDLFRESVAILLRHNGYHVIEASSLKEGLNAIQNQTVDLIITDLKMSDGTGLDLLKKVRESRHEIAVIIQTAYGSVRNAVDAMRQGAYDYVAKPFKNDELLVVVEKALENRNLREELSLLREEIAWKYGFDNLIGVSAPMKQLKTLAVRVAATDISILITGESGTGKELLAKAIHYHSQRRQHKFIPIDCTSIPADLLESELFGHVKGSFTSAFSNHRGLFEEADHGTIFLDEIGDMPVSLQAKILRVLQESEIRPVGSSISRKINVRILAATNKELASLVKSGAFREDLFYRLNVLPIHIPPLRERAEDIAVMVQHFLQLEQVRRDSAPVSISADAMEKLIHHRWPGNVRELENTIKRALALSLDGRIKSADIIFVTTPAAPSSAPVALTADLESGTLEASLKERIQTALYANNWNFTRTATRLGIGRTTLWRKVKKYNIARNDDALEPNGAHFVESIENESE